MTDNPQEIATNYVLYVQIGTAMISLASLAIVAVIHLVSSGKWIGQVKTEIESIKQLFISSKKEFVDYKQETNQYIENIESKIEEVSKKTLEALIIIPNMKTEIQDIKNKINNGMSEKLTRVETRVDEIANNQREFFKKTDNLTIQITNVDTDVHELKKDVDHFQKDINEFKGDILEFKKKYK